MVAYISPFDIDDGMHSWIAFLKHLKFFFFQGLLALEGELTPVLVHLVKSDKYVTGMLDAPSDVALCLQR